MITTELREWAKRSMVLPPQETESILAIADRIDAEHESKVSYWQDASYKDGYDEGFASADDYFTDKRETLKEHGWMRLPLDADGVPIRVGDVLDCDANGYKGTFSVFAVGHNVVVGNHPEEFWYKRPMNTFHVARFCHAPPTVEDVLRAMLDALDVDVCDDPDATIAEYAAKLRLAGEGE